MFVCRLIVAKKKKKEQSPLAPFYGKIGPKSANSTYVFMHKQIIIYYIRDQVWGSDRRIGISNVRSYFLIKIIY